MLRLCILALAAALSLPAAEHHGVVKFGGLPLPGATVTATQGDKKFVALTNDQGAYSFPNLTDGAWMLQVDMLCFAPQKQEITAAAAPIEWELKLLPFSEIAASAPAPPTPAPRPPAAIETSVAPQPAKPESKLTLKTRNNKGAPPTAPGQNSFQRSDLNASGAPPAANDATPAASASDTQNASDSFAINGSVNNGAASPFSQSAAFGNFRKNPNGLYRGALGVTLDNSALDARSFSLTGQDTPKPAYNHLTGTASFGGPLRIPHLLTGNSTQFFVGYQWMRNRNATLQSTSVPTAAERAGDFSQIPGIHLVDPTTGAPFPGNVIPQSRISPQAQALLRFYPLPNFDQSARYNYQVPIVGIGNQDAVTSRLNRTINGRNQVYGTFAWQRTFTNSRNLFGFLDTTETSGLNTAANWQRRIGQRMFAHLQFQYSRLSTRITPNFANRENVSGEAGISGNNQDPLNWGPPSLNFSSGIATLSDQNQAFNRNQTSALSYDTLWSHRSHNITFGADYKRQQFNQLSQQNPRGSFTFTGAAAGSDFGGFLLGIPDTSSIAFGNADKYFRASIYDAYVTDDWRIAPGLTMNAGVRWEYNAPITELYGRLVNLDVAPGFPAVAPVVAATPTGSLTGRTYPDSLVHPDKSGFEPRIGVSWRPLAGSSMVVRAGYGVYRNTSVYQSIASQMAQQSPLSKSLSVQNGAANPLTLANGFSSSNGITQNTFAIDPNFRVGYAHNWQLSVQRDLPGSMVMTATYLGIKGSRAVQEFLPNTYPLGAVNPCLSCPSGFIYMTSNGNSTRESGSLQLRRRLHNGITASLQYTYSKSIDDAALGGRGQGTAVIAQNWLNLDGERALSNFDQRHLLNVQMQYTTGMGVGGGTLLEGWRGALFKEWNFSSTITAGSGLPLTPVYTAAVAGTGVTGSIRPNYTGASLYSAPAGLFLNPAAYTAPALGQWGNAGRNTITGPNQFSLNASMGRTFRLTDRYNADFRFDATNALNHVTFASWNASITSAQFGLPTAANAMRSLQATLRVRF